MIDHVAVVGAGTMGRGVVWALAQAGITVTFREPTIEGARLALDLLEADLEKEIERWSLTKSEKASMLAKIHPTASLKDLSAASLLIESIPDDLELKAQLFRDLDEVMPERQVFISNTSSLSITELASVTRRSERFLGMHFSLPVPKRPLVEIVRGRKTSDETVGRARELAEVMGKTAIEVFESPGFVTTRMIVPYLNEAMNIVMEGIASAEDVDTAMKLGFDFPIGPLCMADKMGLDEVLMWMEKLYEEMGDLRYKPSPLLRRLVFKGHLGVKSGRGFFRYTASGQRLLSSEHEYDYSAGGLV